MDKFAQVQKPADSGMYFWYLCHETKRYLILDYFAIFKIISKNNMT